MDLNLDFSANNLDNDNHYDIVIIGGGPAGATAAIYTARADLKTLVVDKGLTAGALGLTAKIANYPGVPGEISGAALLKIMREQAQSPRLRSRSSCITASRWSPIGRSRNFKAVLPLAQP